MNGSLHRALGISSPQVVAFIGAGGKTSALRRLAAEAAAAGCRSLLLSTTRIEPQRGEVVTVAVTSLEEAVAAIRSHAGATPLLLVTERLPTRWRGVPPEWVAELARLQAVDEVLVQADGSSRRPFKAPAPHEPAIPDGSSLVVAVMGIDAVGQPIDARGVHRPEWVARFSGLAEGEPLTAAAAAAVILHPEGGFRAAPPRRAVLINKVDSAERLRQAAEVAAALRQRTAIRVVAAALREADPVRRVWE